VLGHLPRVVAIVSAISLFRWVMCGLQYLLLLLLQSVVVQCNLVSITSGNDNKHVFD
jgi:hypothetical protein